MNRPIWPRLGRTFALGLTTLAAEQATAQEPAPVPAVHSTPIAQPQVPPTPEVEIYHGTKKVGPVTPTVIYVERPAPVPDPAPVVPSVAKMWLTSPETPVTDAFVNTLHAFRDGTTRISRATATVIDRVGERMQNPAEPRMIFPVVYTPPAPVSAPAHPTASMPWLTPVPSAPPSAPVPTTPAPVAQETAKPSQPTTPPQPTVVVLRESAEAPSRPATPVPEAPRGITLGTETLIGLGIGVLGLGFGLAGWRRTSRETPASSTEIATPMMPVFAPVQSNGDGVMLMGQYDAGPMPEPTEKFEIGPTYQEEQQVKKQVEAQNQQAVVEFILNQNLALHTELAPPPTNTPVDEEQLPFAQ